MAKKGGWLMPAILLVQTLPLSTQFPEPSSFYQQSDSVGRDRLMAQPDASPPPPDIHWLLPCTLYLFTVRSVYMPNKFGRESRTTWPHLSSILLYVYSAKLVRLVRSNMMALCRYTSLVKITDLHVQVVL